MPEPTTLIHSYRSGLLVDFEVGHEGTEMKLRHDCVNLQKLAINRNPEVGEQTGEYAAFDIDSNKRHFESVKDGCFYAAEETDYPKRQQDIENEELKKQTRTRIIDLEQCQDSSLRSIQSDQFSSAPLVLFPKQPETSVKSTLCGGSETAVKMNFAVAAETQQGLASKTDSCACVVDLCQVEPALEKGSLETEISEKRTDGDAHVKMEDSGCLTNELIWKKLADKEELKHGSRITQDAVYQTHSRMKGKKQLFQEFVTESPVSSNVKDAPAPRTTSHYCHSVTEQWRDKKEVQKFFHKLLVMKKLQLERENAKCEDDKWKIWWTEQSKLLWSKHPSPHRRCELWNKLEWWIARYGRQSPTGGSSNSGGQYNSAPAGSHYGNSAASGNQRCGFTSLPSNGSQGGSGHGGDERDPGRNWSPTGYDGKRYTEEKKKMKDKRRLEEGILAWLLQNEVEVTAIADDWQSIVMDCTSICLAGDSHKNCTICDALVIQLKHCAVASCDVNSCVVCQRVVAVISLHYADCRQRPQQCCCGRYLTASPDFAATFTLCVDQVRSYLLSLFPALPDRVDDDDGDDDDKDDGDGDGNEDDLGNEEDKDYNSDSSDDSIMMPSFSSDISSFQPPASETPGSAVPEGGACGIMRDLPGLFGRGINSATTVTPPGFGNDPHRTLPVLESVGAARVAEMSDPRLCISSEASPGTVDMGSASMPVISGSRPRGRMQYGTKSRLQKLASSWQSYADLAKRDGMQRLHELPAEGVILDDFRNEILLNNGNYEEEKEWMICSHVLGTNGVFAAGACGKCIAGIDWTTKARFCVKKINILKFDANELTVWGKLEHPDVVRLYGAMVCTDSVYIFQELIRGSTLKEYIARSRFTGLDTYTALLLMQNLLRILLYLQSKNVIHNDIKADNLMLRSNDTLRLVMIDFGLSVNCKYVPPSTHPTGSQTHWSPEKAASLGYDVGADLWAVVAVFVHMLSGSEPWIVRYSHKCCLHYIIWETSPPMQDVPPGLPALVYSLIRAGWTVDKAKRPDAATLLQHKAFSLLDTCLSTDAAFYHHLRVRTPAEDKPLNLPSDDSETEHLISAAEELLSAPTDDRQCDAHETVSFEVQVNDERGLAEAALHEPHLIKLPVEESASAEPMLNNLAAAELTGADEVGCGVPEIQVSHCDLVVEKFEGGVAYKVPQSVLDLLLNSPQHLPVRQRSEPLSSVAGTGEPSKLEHQASAPANVEEAAISVNKESDATAIHKESDATTVLQPPVKLEISSMCCQLAAEPCHQSATLSASRTTSSVSNAVPLNLNQGGSEAVVSDVTRSHLPSESTSSLPSQNGVSQQVPGLWQGSPPKFPSTEPSETKLLPLFVEEEILSDDEEDAEDLDLEKYGKPSSAMMLCLNQSVPQVMSEDTSGLAGNVTTQFQVPVVTSNSTSEHPVRNDVGFLLELDLRNNDESEPVWRPPSDGSLCEFASGFFAPSSIGTTVVIYHESDIVYRIHLHPGRDHYWSEVLLRASSAIHSCGLAEFTAQQLIGAEFVRIDIDEQIPSDPQLSIVVMPVFDSWVWKIEDSTISYHPGYQGQFGPRWDD